jgi:hypothetical protein
VGEKDLIRPYGTVPGTSITIYESAYPQPGTVLLVPHKLENRPTRSRSEVSKRRGSAEQEFVTIRPGVVRERGLVSSPGEAMGWMLRALKPENEAKISTEDHSTLTKVSSLFARIDRDRKTWLEPDLPPIGGKADSRLSPVGNAIGKKIWVPWVWEDCIPWLVFEGTKLGLRFAAGGAATRRETSGLPTSQYLINLLQSAIANPSNYECKIEAPRGVGIRSAAQAMGVQDIQAISMPAMELYRSFALSLKSSADKRKVFEAYHRILLHRFLRRRRLTPPARVTRASDPVSDAIERRANLLQAHRLFVFNEKGCPVSVNAETLHMNGLDPSALGKRRVSNPEAPVVEWTMWLYSDVLEKPVSECLTKIRGLESLAAAGYLG